MTGPDTVAGQRTGAGTGVGLGTGVGTAAGLRPVPFLRVFGVEVRKTLDTRSGQLLLAGVLLLSVLGTVWAWIGVGLSYPASLTPAMTFSSSSKLVKPSFI